MQEHIVSQNKHGRYCVPAGSRHRPAAKKILAGDVHEPETIEFLTANCGSGDVVHAGTYFGDFLPALSRACAPGAKVWAFEPNPDNFRCAQATLQINGIGNVVLTHAALGAGRGSVRVRTTDKKGRGLGGASQVVADGDAGTAGTEEVRMISIDEAIEEDRWIAIIQLDVEGFEAEALRGAVRTLRRCKPIVVVEVFADSPLGQRDWFAEHVGESDYERGADIHDNLVFRPRVPAPFPGGLPA